MLIHIEAFVFYDRVAIELVLLLVVAGRLGFIVKMPIAINMAQRAVFTLLVLPESAHIVLVFHCAAIPLRRGGGPSLKVQQTRSRARHYHLGRRDRGIVLVGRGAKPSVNSVSVQKQFATERGSGR